jgi:hypothetical protein
MSGDPRLALQAIAAVGRITGVFIVSLLRRAVRRRRQHPPWPANAAACIK